MAAHEQEGAGRQKERLSGLLGVARAASCARLRAVTQPRTFAPSRRPASGLGPRASSSSVHHSPPRPKTPPPADAAALGSRRLQPGERHPPTTHTTDQHSLSTGVLCKMACIAAASKATTTGRPFGGREPTPCDPPPTNGPALQRAYLECVCCHAGRGPQQKKTHRACRREPQAFRRA